MSIYEGGPNPAYPLSRMRERLARAARRVRVAVPMDTLTLPSLRDGPLPLPQAGEGY